MRRAVSAAFALIVIATAAHASDRSMSLDLPSGSLAVAIAAIGAETGANIGTSDPTLLSRRLPALHLKGSSAYLLARIARAANVRAVRVGPNGWRLEPRARTTPRRPLPVAPPASPPATGEDILIIAGSKRSQRFSDYPGEATVIDSALLDRDRTITNLAGLASHVPTLASTDWGTGQDKVFLRGVADSSFAGSSPALVGQYLGDQRLTYSAPDPGLRLYDIASIEILDGPQGTLYGMGSLGGLIRIAPRAPQLDSLNGEIWSDVSTTAHGGVGGEAGLIANVPIATDRAGLRIVGYESLDPGYIDDTARGLKDVNTSRTRGGRGVLRWRIASGWSLDLTGFAQRIDNRDAPYVDRGASSLTRSSSIAQPSFDTLAGANMVLSGRFGDLELRSSTGFVSQSFGQVFDVLAPGREYMFEATDHSRLLTHETRLSGTSRQGSWVVGIGLLDSIDRQSRFYGLTNLPAPLAALTNKVFDVTAFGEITERLTGPLSFTLGAHYSVDRLTGGVVDLRPIFHLTTQLNHPEKTEHHFLPAASLLLRLGRDDVMFVRYERGYRTGGLTGDGTGQSYAGDDIATFEAGVRLGTPGSDRLAFAITGAASRWHNIQADLLDGLGLPYIANVGDGRILSLDASLSLRLARGWRVEAAGFVTHTRLAAVPDVAAEGDADILPNVADNGGTLTLNYTRSLGGATTFHAGLGVQHVGRSRFGVGPSLAFPQGGYTALKLNGDVRLGAFGIVFDVSNLLDDRGNAFAIGTPFAAFQKQQFTPLRPRTVRLGARYTF